MKIARIAALSAALVLGGCATGYTLVDAAKPVAVGDGVSVTTDIAWSKSPFPGFPGTLWTVDGEGLDMVMFFTGIESGKPIIETRNADKDQIKVYQSSMVPDDVMELLGANLGKVGYQQVRTANLRPAPFGTTPGFRFDLTMTSADGLEIKGVALGAQRGGKLDLILFIAPAEYYYGHYGDTVEKLFGSVQVASN